MPLLLDRPTSTKSIPLIRELDEMSAASSAEGVMIQKQVDAILRHYSAVLTYSKDDELTRLKAMHFTKEGKATRVAKALQVLKEAKPLPRLDKKTWEWIAEDMEIEDF